MADLVYGSVRLCQNPRFWAYLQSLTDHPVASPAAAANELRQALRIGSRAQLGTCEAAKQRYLSMISAFNQWNRGNAPRGEHGASAPHPS